MTRENVTTKNGVDLRPCRFTFDGEKTYDGYTNGTYWNGFLNVWVTRETHESILIDFTDGYDPDEFSGCEPDETTDGLRLVCYGWGMATQEVTDR